MNIKKKGRNDTNEFFNKFVEINFEEDSKKTININPKK